MKNEGGRASEQAPLFEHREEPPLPLSRFEEVCGDDCNKQATRTQDI